MHNKSQIYDPNTGHGLKVGHEGEASVVVHPHPPFEEEETSIPYRQRFLNLAGSEDMNVDGSVTEQRFFIQAITDFDIYVNSLSVKISDTGAPNLLKFGNLSALTNGVEWTWETQDLGVEILHDGIKTNLEFIRTGNKTVGIGTGSDAFLADVSGGGTEKAYLPVIDISEQFGKPWGIRLRKGTVDKMVFTVRDNLSTLSGMDVIAYGVKF
jgi:hypothetical protein